MNAISTFSKLLLSLAGLMLITACTTGKEGTTTKDKKPALVLKPAAFSQLPAWQEDQIQQALQAFEKSCARLSKADPEKDFGPLPWSGQNKDWQVICAKLPDIHTASSTTARQFFEQNFTPILATADGDERGLFTGYYEASLKGSLTRTDRYQTPLRRRPDDLVQVNLGDFKPEWKGQRIAGRVKDGVLKPYETRAEIVAGLLPLEKELPVIWVDDPVDAFFLQIQGSGIVHMEDGTNMRVGYEAQNGHAYYAIGKELVKRQALKQEDVSMQSIRDWLNKNPQQAVEIMNTNPSYVFFRELKDLSTGDGPLGGESVPLTPERSLAIDRNIIPYGVPVFLDCEHPDPAQKRIQRLVIAQDTGGAIKGPVRGDVFWGNGATAEKYAGLMKSSGRYWFLVPQSLARTIK